MVNKNSLKPVVTQKVIDHRNERNYFERGQASQVKPELNEPVVTEETETAPQSPSPEQASEESTEEQ